MNINLLPRKTFVEKRFFVLTVTMLVLLLATAYGLWYLYMTHQATNLDLQLEIQGKKLEQARLLSNLGWNEEVRLYEEQIMNIRRYQLLADALQITEVKWSDILAHIESLLPSTTNLRSISTEGDTIHGIVHLDDITVATRFIEDMQRYEHFSDVRISIVERSGTLGIFDTILDDNLEDEADILYEVRFSAYLRILPF